MKVVMTITLFFTGLWAFGACPARILSVGMLTFKAGTQTYVADSTHARGYVNRATDIGYITAANSHDLVVDIEKKDMKMVGTYVLQAKNAKAVFTLNNKTYSLRREEDYLRITITSVKTQGSFYLLNGRFEGRLTDKQGNAVKIGEGYFETLNL